MSCIDWPLTWSGLCCPIHQSTASVMLHLPHPLGPTMTLTPGANSSLVRSGNDLNPLMVIELRCTGSGRLSVSSDGISGLAGVSPREGCFLPLQALQRLGRSRLFRGFLAPALAGADHLGIQPRRDLEAPVVRRPRLTGHGVGYAGALPCKPLLKRGLEVEHRLQREVDLVGESGNRRLRGRGVAVFQVAGADHRLTDRRHGALACEQ